jgi:serine/threonine protein kinase
MEVPGYEIGERIGRGGMGAVYRARHLAASRREVALKVIHPNFADDEEFVSRFRSEMKVAGALEHPNIVPVYEVGEAEGHPFIAMELIPGEDLGKMIKHQGPLDPELAVSLIQQVASALDAAHEKKIIHRDVKPANILVDSGKGRAYLSDFGIAKSLDASRAETRTGQGLGSLQYMAPEQLEGRLPDQRTDVYSLGCVLLQTLTGELPYEDGLDGYVLRQKLDTEPRRASALRPDIGQSLDEVCAIALARDPRKRFRSAGEFAAAASDALDGVSPTRNMSGGSSGVATTHMNGSAGVGQTDRTKVQPEPGGWGRRISPNAIGVAIAILALVGIGISRSGGGESEPTPARIQLQPALKNAVTPGLIKKRKAILNELKATAPQKPRKVEKAVTPASPISTEGIGPILVGMTESVAEQAGNIELKADALMSGSCQYLTSESLKDVSFMFTEGILSRIDTRNPSSATLSGVGVGDSEADVYAVYGDRIKSAPNAYIPETASYLTYVPEDPLDNTRVLFDVNEGKVVNIRSGRLPQINYIEGCA